MTSPADRLKKNILLIIPNKQFSDTELFGVLEVFTSAGVGRVVLSKSGREVAGADRKRLQPDGPIIDWDKQAGFSGKYPAVIVIGGKGARKSLWDDTIVPKILVDHYRAGSVIAALGSASVVLARAGLLTDGCAAPDDEAAQAELDSLGIYCSDQLIEESNRIITGSGGQAARSLAQRVVALLAEDSL